jgi:hypothetical protein
MITPQFSPGFRLSIIDIIVLILGALGTFLVVQIEIGLGLAIAFTVGHFFLFCNVIRMPRHLELIWAALFILLAVSTITIHLPGWYTSFTISFVCTIVLVFIQMRRPSYHGVGWRQINPNLLQWWQSQHGEN